MAIRKGVRGAGALGENEPQHHAEADASSAQPKSGPENAIARACGTTSRRTASSVGRRSSRSSPGRMSQLEVASRRRTQRASSLMTSVSVASDARETSIVRTGFDRPQQRRVPDRETAHAPSPLATTEVDEGSAAGARRGGSRRQLHPKSAHAMRTAAERMRVVAALDRVLVQITEGSRGPRVTSALPEAPWSPLWLSHPRGPSRRCYRISTHSRLETLATPQCVALIAEGSRVRRTRFPDTSPQCSILR